MTGRIIKRGDQVYLLQVDLGRDSNGKRNVHTETVHGERKAAEARLRKIIDEFEGGNVPLKPCKKTLNEVLAEWLEAVKSKLSARTHQDYVWVVKRYLKKDLGPLPIFRVMPIGVQRLYTKLSNEGLSSASIKKLHWLLTKFFRWAMQMRMASLNPCTGVILPESKKANPRRSMSVKEAKAFLEACLLHPFGPIFIFAVLTGLRPQEFQALQWSDLDLEECSLTISKAIFRPRGGGWTFITPKSQASRRTVSLDPRLLPLLARHRDDQDKARLKAGNLWDHTHQFIFSGDLGQPLAESTLRKAFKEIIKAAQLPADLPIYSLRHTHITMLGQVGGETAATVAHRVGHSDISLTLSTYTHVLMENQISAASKVGDILGYS